MQKKIKVAYVSNFPHFRMGGQRSMLELIENLDRDLIIPIGIVPAEGELAQKLRSLNVPVYINASPKIKLRNLTSVFKALLGFRRIFKKEKVDIVHPDMERDAFLCGLAKIFTNTKMIWHVRLTRPDRQDYLNYIFSEAVIGISDAVGRRFKQRRGFANKYITIFNGTDLSKFKPVKNKDELRSNLKLDKSKFYVLFVGQLKDGKGVYDILNAAEMLKHNNSIKFLLCGNASDPNKSIEYENYVMKHKLTNVSFKGHQKEIHEWMKSSDCLILPSYEGVEGMGRVIFEAMACGCVPIGTMISGISEAITLDTGKLVPQKRPDSIANAILELYENPEDKDNYISMGLKRAKEEFDIKVHAKKVMGVYKTLNDR